MAGMSEQQLINHLLFHKAIIVEDGEETRIDDYIRIAKERGDGRHVAIEDPFDRSISLAFELVLEQGMDPWAIDLVRFTSLYMERVKEGAQIDLITAGKLLHMAWSILRLQSERLRESAEPPPPPPEPEGFAWDDIDMSVLAEDPNQAFNDVVERARPDDLLDEKVRHKGDRKVTLMELVSALEDARREADARSQLVAAREGEKTRRAKARQGRAEGAAHKEDQEEDIREVWERILGQNGAPIPITSIQERTRDGLVKTLVSVLFLAKAQRIKLWQEDFPYGMIYVQNPGADAHPADDATPTGKVELKHVQN